MRVVGIEHVQLAMPPGGEGLPSGAKGTPALLVDGLAELVVSLRDNGHAVVDDAPLEGFFRVYVSDPFGNRMMEPSA